MTSKDVTNVDIEPTPPPSAICALSRFALFRFSFSVRSRARATEPARARPSGRAYAHRPLHPLSRNAISLSGAAQSGCKVWRPDDTPAPRGGCNCCGAGPPSVGLEATTTKRRPLERTLPQSAYRSAVAFASSYASPPFCLPASRCQSSFVLPWAFLITQARSHDQSLIRAALSPLRYHPSCCGLWAHRADHCATTFFFPLAFPERQGAFTRVWPHPMSLWLFLASTERFGKTKSRMQHPGFPRDHSPQY